MTGRNLNFREWQVGSAKPTIGSEDGIRQLRQPPATVRSKTRSYFYKQGLCVDCSIYVELPPHPNARRPGFANAIFQCPQMARSHVLATIVAGLCTLSLILLYGLKVSEFSGSFLGWGRPHVFTSIDDNPERATFLLGTGKADITGCVEYLFSDNSPQY